MTNVYLEDLQLQIVANLGVIVSQKLIWETLRHNSLTMKKVNAHQPLLETQVEQYAYPGSLCCSRTVRPQMSEVLHVAWISQQYTKDQLVFADDTSFN